MIKDIKLTNEQIRDLNQSHQDLSHVLTECDKADNCGIDCQPLREAIAGTMQNIEALLATYGPKRKQ